MMDSGSNPALVPILLRTSKGRGTALPPAGLSERIKQLADIYSFFFAQLDTSANAKK